MRRMALLLPLLLLWTAAAFAQDAERGQRLFNQTPAAVGKPVASCAGCHADVDVLRAQLTNRGVELNQRALGTVLKRAIAGAQPGANGAKAQYVGVLNDRDIDDLAAYLAHAKRASAQPSFARR